MDYWVVVFEDTPGMLAHRKEYGADHIAYLKKNREHILVGGGLRASPDAPFFGGLWIVSADTYEEVANLVTSDPYFNPDHRRFKIFAWGKALPDHVQI
ncbi:MAG: YciI family protein [Pseudomonadota bacterium]